MPKLNLLCGLAVVSAIVCTVSFSPAVAVAHAPAEAPKPTTHDFILPPEPYAGFYAYADKCLKKLSDNCGKEIYYSIFAEDSVTERCCVMLVAMGKSCHNVILLATLALPELKEADRYRIIGKSKQIWKECVALSDSALSPSPSPSPSYFDF